MAVPADEDARLFYRAMTERHDDARVLHAAGRGAGAVYMAGYAVECALKALLVTATPARDRGGVIATFRGVRAHDYDWLREQYRAVGGSVPQQLDRPFTVVGEWTTDIRYTPGEFPAPRADRFMAATAIVIAWADARLS